MDSEMNVELMIVCRRSLFKLANFNQNVPQLLIYRWWIANRDYIDESLHLLH